MRMQTLRFHFRPFRYLVLFFNLRRLHGKENSTGGKEMTALFVITLVLLLVSAFYNWLLWKTARVYREAYYKEKRGRMMDNMIAAGVSVLSLVCFWKRW